jgi:hypothetical protein
MIRMADSEILRAASCNTFCLKVSMTATHIDWTHDAGQRFSFVSLSRCSIFNMVRTLPFSTSSDLALSHAFDASFVLISLYCRCTGRSMQEYKLTHRDESFVHIMEGVVEVSAK